jgi:hypothetical protein
MVLPHFVAQLMLLGETDSRGSISPFYSQKCIVNGRNVKDC